MLSQPHHDRAGARPLIAAFLAAITVAVSSVLFLPAPPASAVPAPPDIQAQIDKAVATATVALQGFECNSMLNPHASFGFTAREVLATYTPDFEPNPAPQFAKSVASVRDFGRNSKITFYPRFALLGTRPTPDTRIELPFGGRPEFDPRADGDLQRAIAILHEVGHLTGIEPAHEGQTDDLGNPLSAEEEEGLYNTRILNVCFTPTFLISNFSCTQNFFFESVYNYRSTLDCFASCEAQPGPVVLSWTSNLSPNVPDVQTVDSENCSGFRTSDCPTSQSSPSLKRVTLAVTDASGHTSADTRLITCYPPLIDSW